MSDQLNGAEVAAPELPPVLNYSITRMDPTGQNDVIHEDVQAAGLDILGTDGQFMTIALFDVESTPQGLLKRHVRAIAGVFEFALLSSLNS